MAGGEPLRGVSRLIPPAAILALLYLGSLWVMYVRCPFFVDQGEASVAMQAEGLVYGDPLYLPYDAADRTSMIYGPVPFVVHAALLRRFANPMVATKIAGIGASAASVILLLVSFLRRRPPWQTGALVLYIVLTYLCFSDVSFWDRPDSFELAGIAGCVCAAAFIRPEGSISNRSLVIGLGMGIGLAVATGSKIHAILYGLPIVYWCGTSAGTSGWRMLIGVTAGFAATMTLPFVLYPGQIGVAAYVRWIDVALRHPHAVAIFARNVQVFAAFVSPLIVVAVVTTAEQWTTWRRSTAWLLVCGVAVCVIASKVGAGPSHVLPLAIPIAFLAGEGLRHPARVRQRAWTRVAVVAIALAGSWSIAHRAFLNQHALVRTLTDRAHAIEAVQATGELRQIQHDYQAARISMGYSDSAKPDAAYQLTWLKPLMSHDTAVAFIDAPALMDMECAGLQLPFSTISKLASRQIGVFVIPRGGEPFVKLSYCDGHDIFSSQFRSVFNENYAKKEERRFFAVWLARSPAHQP